MKGIKPHFPKTGRDVSVSRQAANKSAHFLQAHHRHSHMALASLRLAARHTLDFIEVLLRKVNTLAFRRADYQIANHRSACVCYAPALPARHFKPLVFGKILDFQGRFPVSHHQKGCVANFEPIKCGLISGRTYAASSAKTSNGERLSFANCFLRIICATSIPAIVADAE